MRITALRASLLAAVASMDGLLEVAANDNGRELTADEQTAFDGHATEAKDLQAKIAREEQLLAFKSSAATPVTVPGGPAPTVPGVVAAKPVPGAIVARLAIAMAATGGNDQRAMADHAQRIWGDETGQIVANMEQATGVKGGLLVNTAYSTEFIDLLRPRVTIRKLGARSVPMPDGNLTMRKQTGSTTAGYVGERVPAPTTDLTVGNLTMTAKKLMALVPITNQLIRRAAFGVDGMVRDDLVTSAAIKEDQQFLRGIGSATAPAGLKSLIAAGNAFNMTAAPTLATVTSDLGKLRLAVLAANTPMISCGWIMGPRVKVYLENLRDGNGNFVFPTMGGEMPTLYGYPVEMSTSVPENLGAGTNESEVYFGDFAQFLIGDTMQVALAASTEAAYDDGGTMRAAFSNDETVIRLIQEHDTQVRYDRAFAVLNGVTWAP